MRRVRLAATVRQTEEYTVPLITDVPREFDFEPAKGDRFAVGSDGRWVIVVTGRRVGLDGVLTVFGDFGQQVEDGRNRDPIDELVGRGWMPDLVAFTAATPTGYLREYLPPPAEAPTDPVETLKYVARALEHVPQSSTDIPRSFYSAIITWAEEMGVIEKLPDRP